MPIASLIICWLLLGAPEAAAQPGAADAYQAGLACFERLDYACAVDLLTAASYAAHGSDRDRWCDIHRKLAESQLALGRPDRAVEAFERLLSRVPDYRIDRPGTSPKILDALERARRELLEPPPSLPPSGGVDPAEARARTEARARPLVLSLTGGAEFLVGEDSRLLEIGSALDLGLSYRYAPGWVLGGGLRWTSHALTRGGASVHLVGGFAGGGPSFTIGPVRLSGLIGLGAARFFVPGQDGKTALFVPLRLGVDFELVDRIWLGIGFSPSWLLSFGAFDSSLTFDLSAGLAVGL